MALSSDGWNSAGSADGWDDWSAGQPVQATDQWSGGFDEQGWVAPRPVPLTVLWVGLVAAAVGLLLGVYVLFTSNYATDPLSSAAVTAIVLGWVLSGVVAVLAVARYQSIDLLKATSAFYAPNSGASALRLVVLIIGAVGVVITSYVFATWLARH